MKRLSLLLLLPLASGALLAQVAGPVINPATLPNGTVGVLYTTTNLTLSNLAVAAWSISAGSFPPGLTLSPPATTTSAAAMISGTPTTAGSYTFTVQAAIGINSEVTYVTRGYTVVIAGPQVPPVYIAQTTLPNGTVGSPYSQTLTAGGGYGAGTYTFSLDLSNPGSLPPGIGISTSGTISGTPSQAGIFIFAVKVISQSANGAFVSASQGYSITITGAPLAIATTSLPAGTVGTPYSQNLTATGGTPPYTWQLTGSTLSVGLTLSTSGTFSGTPVTAGSFTYQVVVTDSAQGSASGSFTIRINPALVITTTSLPSGTVGTSYTATTLAATGGTPPYTWSLASGALPGGLSVSSAGVISGTPTAAGTFSVTLKVTDSAQATATQSYSVTVAAATVPLSVTTQAPLAGGEVGVAYTQAFAATGGTPPYQWTISAGTVPLGFTLNPTTGSLTGTPTVAGTSNFTVQVADSASHTATKAFTITVIAAVKITPVTPPGGVTGVSYTQQFAATGGVTPYVWSIASGSIPTGLSLSTATGLLSGTPTTAGTYTFTIAVADQNGGKDSATFSITIVATLAITTQYPLPGAADGMVGVPFTLAFAAAGGTSPYQWSVSAGALPTGLTLSAAGSLTGSPTATGTFNFTIQVTDSAGRTATKAFTIVVVQLSITTASPLPPATVGTPYTPQTLAVTGSGEPYLVTYTWSISAGALPGGITLDPSAGSLSGTPSAPGTFTFTVSVTGGGQTATKSLTITVGVPPGPSATITGLPATATPATQPALGISVPNAYPLAITGQVTLTFAPDSPSPDDGQEVVFTTGGRTVSFTVPANTTQVAFSGATPGVQVGTVSGTITLTLKLTAAGIDITPSPAPSTKLTIAKSAPVIKTATVTRTSAGFNLVVVGYATSREMVSANVTFTAATGVTLSSSSATVSLASVFASFYQNPDPPYGSQFSLTMPFTIANATSTVPLTSVSVQLTNAQGSSTTANATY